MLKLYEIVADYRANNIGEHSHYYVCANNKAEAKRRMADTLSHMKVYDIQEITNLKLAEAIVTGWGRYYCHNQLAMMKQQGWKPKPPPKGGRWMVVYSNGDEKYLDDVMNANNDETTIGRGGG